MADSSKVSSTKQIIDCAKVSNVKNVVLLSSVGTELDKDVFKEFREIEQMLIESGLVYCIVR